MKIAFFGAGGIARHRHLPGLSALPDVEVVVVVNRTIESGRQVAEEYGIPEVAADWQQVLQRDDIDAIFIGTWPHMHRDMAVAGLQAGKHVFCQARMARDLSEAQDMVAAAEAAPGLVNMICPPPHRMPYELFIKKTVDSGELGNIVSVELTAASGANLDPTVYTWREDRELSGNQILAVGIFAETLNAWVGDYETLTAITATPQPEKNTPDGPITVTIPQVVTVAGRLESGALISEHHTGLATPESRSTVLVIRGSKGSLRHSFGDAVPEISDGKGGWAKATVPADLTRPWQVERDFVDAVQRAGRGESWTVSPDFAEGLRYMKKMQAIHVSARERRTVSVADL